jgi:hypothetical protein
MKKSLSYFTGSFIFCIIALILAFYIGGTSALITVIFLTLLETSLSFDNAVVNAGILKHWDAKWRQRFLTWGILIAVFGMRLVFPLAIVGLAGHIGPIETINLAIYQPKQYETILSSAHHQIAAFGGTFLMMVFFHYFIAEHKTDHWLHTIESSLTRLGKMEAMQTALTLIILLTISHFLPSALQTEFLQAGIWGILIFIVTKGITALLGEGDGTGHIVKQGAAGFIYLELIDASFSFDGVIGAFALTNNLFIIALGLGAGAMFVRSFTLLLVERNTLSHFRYLEHGAFWAIGALSVLMLIGPIMHVSEAVTGTLGAILIVTSLAHSIIENKRENKINPTT